MRRICAAAAVAVSLLAMGAAPALAASVDVAATPSNSFDPDSVAINQGDTVTWTNTGGFHNVHFEDGSFDMPPDPAPDAWSYARRFDAPGTYGYYCEEHRSVGMTGTVVVSALPPPPAGGGGGGGPAPGPAAPDAPPVSTVSSPSRQDVDKLYVRASMNEAGTLSAQGTVSAPRGAAKVYRLKRAAKTVAANQRVKLRLKLSKKALRAVKRALRHRRKVRAKVTVTARDAAGHQTVLKQTIRLTR